mmetsp:Transcript_73370/g.162905  ORF Transcript_73370/g.162905 Transcript_73370/m.162905 type:complete len:210 (-) Transcript_73370:1313-1942(-)
MREVWLSPLSHSHRCAEPPTSRRTSHQGSHAVRVLRHGLLAHLGGEPLRHGRPEVAGLQGGRLGAVVGVWPEGQVPRGQKGLKVSVAHEVESRARRRQQTRRGAGGPARAAAWGGWRRAHGWWGKLQVEARHARRAAVTRRAGGLLGAWRVRRGDRLLEVVQHPPPVAREERRELRTLIRQQVQLLHRLRAAQVDGHDGDHARAAECLP